jgi:two-component sensor histidine kinase
MFNLPNQFWNLATPVAPRRPLVFAWALDVALAAVLTAVAFAARIFLGFIGPGILIFAVCYPLLLIATLVAGARAGALTLVLTILLFWYAFVPERYSYILSATVDGVNVALYLVAGLAIIAIGEAYRRTYAKLQVERARTKLLIREMQHRKKNAVAVMSSIVAQSLKHDPDSAKKITGRLVALQIGEDILWSDDQARVALRDILVRQLESYDASRLTIDGPDAFISGELARTLCLVVNELATNAVKYGALSDDSGRVAVTWGDSPDPTYLHWSETGGPPATKPEKAGFGTFLMGRLLSQHGGSITTSYNGAKGLVCTVNFQDVSPRSGL